MPDTLLFQPLLAAATGTAPHPAMMLPFAILLAAIALMPLLHKHWWEHHYPKVALALALVPVGYYLFVLNQAGRLLHVGHEYLSFLALVGSLFVVSGGIHLSVKGEATPLANTVFLLIGGVLANLLGTTGASMLFIRPWLRMNKYRVTAHHVVFFIFIVSNVGGCLTPIGDPPLFLGYLNGVPFWWVTQHAWPAWLTAMGALLAMFFIVDTRNYLRAPKPVRAALAEPKDQWGCEGLLNLLFLGVILGAVFIHQPLFLREALMVGAAAASYFTTKRRVHEANDFNFGPIKEVAILFIGIFATMVPALDWLMVNAGRLQNPSPAFFYWGTGLLSGVLDNAPTYLGFLSAAVGKISADQPAGTDVSLAALLADPAFNQTLLAISVGAVFFGANTYIGNGPNFMVKAIADHQKVHTPSFLGYILRFTLPCLLPVLILVWWLFFRTG